MTEFGLGIASKDLEFFGKRDPLFDLLLCSLRVDDRNEGCFCGCLRESGYQ